MKPDLRGVTTESWVCVDCGFDTAPGCLDREQMEQAMAHPWEGPKPYINHQSEVYMVTPEIWKAVGMEPIRTGGVQRHEQKIELGRTDSDRQVSERLAID